MPEPVARAEASKGHQWSPLLAYGMDMSTNSVADFDPFGNIVFAGPAGAGSSVAMRALMATALERGWSVDAISPQADEFGALGTGAHARSFHHEVRDLAEASLGQVVQSIEPGSAHRPHLLLLDNVPGYLLSEDGHAQHLPGQRVWLEHLASLMDDPCTAVAIRAQRYFAWLHEQIASRIRVVVQMGRVDRIQRMLLFREAYEKGVTIPLHAHQSVAEQEHAATLEKANSTTLGRLRKAVGFAPDAPVPYTLPAPFGVSLLWDGSAFRHVQGTYLDPMDDASNWSVETPLPAARRISAAAAPE